MVTARERYIREQAVCAKHYIVHSVLFWHFSGFWVWCLFSTCSKNLRTFYLFFISRSRTNGRNALNKSVIVSILTRWPIIQKFICSIDLLSKFGWSKTFLLVKNFNCNYNLTYSTLLRWLPQFLASATKRI